MRLAFAVAPRIAARRLLAFGRTLTAIVATLPAVALADVTSVDTNATLRALSVFQGGGQDITLPIPDGFEDLHESVTANASENRGRGTATLDVDITRSTDGLTVNARGTTDIESPGTLEGLSFTGSGGAVGLGRRGRARDLLLRRRARVLRRVELTRRPDER